MESRSNDIWVFIETSGGAAEKAALEALTPGRALADRLGGRLAAVVLGCEVDAAVRTAGMSGVERIIVADAPEFRLYTTDAYVDALAYLVRKYQPDIFLMGATENSRDLAPRLSARLRTGLASDCTGLEFDPEIGCVAWTRPIFGGQLLETLFCPTQRPQIGTVRPGIFHRPPLIAHEAEIIRENIRVSPGDIHTRILELLADPDSGKVELEEADIVVSGGLGLGGPEGFAPVRALAQVLGGAVGASRGAVDAGWISHAHQIGQTGKKISPKLYIACGLSGANQHVAGMRGAKYIIAINKNPLAPIFDIADYGVVGDLFKVLPVLTEEIRKARM